jgi:hypothetical protein
VAERRGTNLPLGSAVVVDCGRYAGRRGTLAWIDRAMAGGCGSRPYPVVRLPATGRSRARIVRVLSVSPAPSGTERERE